MKPALKPILIFVLLSASLFSQTKADTMDDIALLLKAGNVKGLAVYLAPSVELGILEDSDEFTKVQAEARIKNFFASYPPLAAKIIHRINSHSNYRYGVVQLATTKGIFRVSISLKNNSGKFLISEMKVEAKEGE